MRKVRKTSYPMKDLKTVKEKADNIRGAFQVDPRAPFKGRVLTIVDDIYESGTTMHELATTLQITGALVQGLTVTKTITDPSQD